GEFTVEDYALYDHMRELFITENLFIEPSACAAFAGLTGLGYPEAKAYIERQGLTDVMPQAVHIAWATGGRLVPPAVREQYRNTYLRGAYDTWQS
ncbi:MAG: D-serine ammonia-lyase, partial [Eubacteriales bacterium]|nr:D-serine ammonia-lyase [Eubacteriales bacterium]